MTQLPEPRRVEIPARRGSSGSELAPITQERVPRDVTARFTLARVLERLGSELAVEGLGFADVA